MSTTVTVKIDVPDSLDAVEWFWGMVDEVWYANRHSINNEILDQVCYEVIEEK